MDRAGGPEMGRLPSLMLPFLLLAWLALLGSSGSGWGRCPDPGKGVSVRVWVYGVVHWGRD